MAPKDTLKSRYDSADAARQSVLKNARVAASLTKPWILPPIGQQAGSALPENYQSVGSRGITNLVGRMLLALFPPNMPWFQLDMAPDIKHDPEVPAESKEAIAQLLFLQELQLQATLESAHVSDKDNKGRNRRHVGFRSRKRNVLDQALITGDVLEQLTDDYQIKVFRRDQYVTKRDSSQDVIQHIVKERIDPLTLNDDQRQKSGLDFSKLSDDPADQRMQDLYTEVVWQPESRTWLITQEVNDNRIAESTETITPFFSTPFELAPGEDYGRGFVELNMGDLRSLDDLEKKKLDFAALASKHQIFKDAASTVRDKDLMAETGSIVPGARVQAGRVMDIAFLTVDKVHDFRVVFQTTERKTRDLSKAFLIESDTQPRGERVTATQIQRIALELEGALGGLYAPVADDQQVPLLQRTIHQMRRDNLLPTLPDDAVRIEALTGIAALSREISAGRVMQLTQVIAQLGEDAMRRIDTGVLINVLARYNSVFEPGMIKSEQQVQEEQEQAASQQAEMTATEQAIASAGKVAEQTMTQPEN